MKEIIKKSIFSCFELLRWGMYRLYHERYRSYIIKKTRPRPILILGNGPSLKFMLDKFNDSENYDYCMVNFSPLSSLFFKLKPRFYVLADGAFFSSLHKDLLDKTRELSNKLLEIDWEITLYVPYIFLKQAKNDYGINEKISIIPFTIASFSDSFSFKKIEYWMFKKGLASPLVGNVAIAAIYCMINSGFKTIWLYGVEHSWMTQLIVDDNNRVCMKDTHYYDSSEVKYIPLLKPNGEQERIWEQLRYQAAAFASYGKLQGYAEYLGGVNIINKTKGSFIDAFPRFLD